MRRATPLLCALVLLATLVTPATAQDGPGWLYVGLDGDIVAMRPDGTDQRNLTATADRWEDHPDVYDVSGRDVITQYQLIGEDGEPTRQGGMHYINPVTPGNDFDPLSGSFVAETYAPSWGFDTSRFFYSDGGDEIGAVYFFEGRAATIVANRGGANGYFDPDGTPSQTDRDEVLYTFTAGGRLGGLRLLNFGESPTDLLVAAGKYAAAGYGRYYADGDQVVFSCRISDGGPLQLCRSAPDQEGTGFAAIPTPVDAINAAVSPDGTRVAFRGTDGSVWVAGIDGSNPTQLVGAASGEGLDWGQEIPLRGGPTPEPPTPPEPEPPADPAPNTPLEPGGTDGDPTTTERAAFTDAGPYSTAVSQARYPSTSFAGEAAGPAYAILSRDDAFADSLAGSALSGDGPILFTPTDELAPDVADELTRVLPPGGTVYLLGGTAALAESVADAVSALGLTPERLSGPSRFETAVAVAREVIALGGSTDEVLVARGTGPADNPTAAWADSVTGGAYAAAARTPVVVTPSEDLHPAVEALVADTDATAVRLGGDAALSPAVEAALPGSRRIAGTDRADTAGAIATELLDYGVDGPRTALVLNGFADDGWIFGLAAAGLAADLGGALLVVGADTVPPATQALLSTCGDPQVEVLVLGWRTVIQDPVLEEIDRLDGGACG
ncbi:cell wall-binding repeat-containing protein [Euzebya sp.]|uniref:cell wall-binding repeat-containing protein n=1 Tax=Euzebya sp. TaxID=1971409 RepID=UPI003515F8F8